MTYETDKWLQEQVQFLELYEMYVPLLTQGGLLSMFPERVAEIIEKKSPDELKELYTLLDQLNMALFRRLVESTGQREKWMESEYILPLFRIFDRLNFPHKYEKESLFDYEAAFEMKGASGKNYMWMMIATEIPELMAWIFPPPGGFQYLTSNLLSISDMKQVIEFPELWKMISFTGYKRILRDYKVTTETVQQFPGLVNFLDTYKHTDRYYPEMWSMRHEFVDGLLEALPRIRVPELKMRTRSRGIISELSLDSFICEELQWIPEQNFGVSTADFFNMPKPEQAQFLKKQIERGQTRPVTLEDFDTFPRSVQRWIDHMCVNTVRHDPEQSAALNADPHLRELSHIASQNEQLLMKLFDEHSHLTPLRGLLKLLGYEIEANFPTGVPSNIFEMLHEQKFKKGVGGHNAKLEHSPGPFPPYTTAVTFQKWVEAELLNFHEENSFTFHFNTDLATKEEAAKLVRILHACMYSYKIKYEKKSSKKSAWKDQVHILRLFINRQDTGLAYMESKDFYAVTLEGTVNQIVVGGMLAAAAFHFENLLKKMKNTGKGEEEFESFSAKTIEEKMAMVWYRLTKKVQEGLSQIGMDQMLKESAPAEQAYRFYSGMEKVYPTIWHQYEVDPFDVDLDPIVFEHDSFEERYPNHVAMMQTLVMKTFEELNQLLGKHVEEYLDVAEQTLRSSKTNTRRLAPYLPDQKNSIAIPTLRKFLDKYEPVLRLMIERGQMIPVETYLPNLLKSKS